MPRILVTFSPRTNEERAVVARHLPDAVWLNDGPDPETVAAAEAALMFWPRQELRDAGRTWDDLSSLRLVKLATAGANHVGWSTLPERIQVATTPGATGPFIAEHVLAFLLDHLRGIHRQTDEIRDGRFHLGAPVQALADQRIGLVGFGGIGQATAALMRSLGCSVEAVNRSGTAAPAARRLIDHLGTMADLPTMAARVDVLVLAVPLHTDTVGLVDAALLQAFDHGMLINVGRGPLVDEKALYQWLQEDPEHRAAGLDVWWRYPKEGRPFTEPFHTLPNVLMTPHDSPNVPGHRIAMLQAACTDLAQWEKTGKIRHLQDRDAHRIDGEGDGR